MDTKTPKSKSRRPIETGAEIDKREDRLTIVTIPITSFVLGGSIPQEGHLIQRVDAKGLDDISILDVKNIPNYDFHQIKLFVVDKDMYTLSTAFLLLDINEDGKEVHKVLSISPESDVVVVENIITKQAVKVEGYLKNPNFAVITGELQNDYIFKRILSGEVKDDTNIIPLIDQEQAEVIKMTKDWLADKTNQDMLLVRAKKINNKFNQNWFGLMEFSTTFKQNPKESYDELNLLKLAGHILVKFNDVKQIEQYKIVFTDKQRLYELSQLEEEYSLKLKEIQEAKRLIVEKSN